MIFLAPNPTCHTQVLLSSPATTVANNLLAANVVACHTFGKRKVWHTRRLQSNRPTFSHSCRTYSYIHTLAAHSHRFRKRGRGNTAGGTGSKAKIESESARPHPKRLCHCPPHPNGEAPANLAPQPPYISLKAGIPTCRRPTDTAGITMDGLVSLLFSVCYVPFTSLHQPDEHHPSLPGPPFLLSP